MNAKRRFFQIAAFISGVIVMIGCGSYDFGTISNTEAYRDPIRLGPIFDPLGTTYAFSTYGPALRDNMGYTQTEVNMIPAVGGAIVYFGTIGLGTLYDCVGPRITLVVGGSLVGGSSLVACGYFLLYLANMHLIPGPNLLLALFFAFFSMGSTAGYYAALNTNMRNFSLNNKGKVTGILSAAYGLSAAMVTQVYKSFFSGRLTDFLLFCAIFLGSLPLTALIFLQQLAPADTEPATPTVASPEDVVVVSMKSPASMTTPLLKPKARIGRYEAFWGFKLYIHPDFWLLGILALLGSGSGLLFINIVGSVAQSWRVTGIATETYVIVLSLCNAGGRFIYGFAVDRFARYLKPVTYLAISYSVIAAAHTLMACWSNEVTLMIGTIATGLAYGGSFAILPLTTSNYYGDAHFGINYALLQVYTNIASLLFSFIAGKIYDAFASVILPNGTHICYGMYCYSFTFTMTAGCSVIATALVIWLTVRERRHDRMLQEKVLAESAVN